MDRGDAEYLLDAITAYNEKHKGQYAVGDREIANLNGQLEKSLARVVHGNPSGETPGAKAAKRSAVDNQRAKEELKPPAGSQQAALVPEGRPVEDQPKSFADAAEEASKRMIAEIKGPDNDS